MKLLPVKLRDLRFGEEFSTCLTRQHGAVIDTGYVLWTDRTGRQTRVRAVLVRFATGLEKILLAELAVLVDADRKHARFSPAEEAARWRCLLREPGGMGTIGEQLAGKGGAR